jgi:hypothetical protein
MINPAMKNRHHKIAAADYQKSSTWENYSGNNRGITQFAKSKLAISRGFIYQDDRYSSLLLPLCSVTLCKPISLTHE